VLCEGSVTEPGYFAYIRSALRDSLIRIEVSRERGDPLRLVEAQCHVEEHDRVVGGRCWWELGDQCNGLLEVLETRRMAY
jgi:hypothetical protein